MDNIEDTVAAALEKLPTSLSQDFPADLVNEFKKEDNDKKLKKKVNKYTVDNNDLPQVAIDKLNMLLEELYKHYEQVAKADHKLVALHRSLKASETERDKMLQQKKMLESLHTGFRGKHKDELAKAEVVEKEEEEKRKNIVNQLQERIKTIQSKYEETGRIKIEKHRENEILKHELMELKPHLAAAESLYDAQLKKKGIEVEISMTTLKQKLEMLGSFKDRKGETEDKLVKAKEEEEKVKARLSYLEKKQEEHKLLLAKAHLSFEDYKKGLNSLKQQLIKAEKQAKYSTSKLFKDEESIKDIRKQVADLDQEYNKNVDQLKGLEQLEQKLSKQLQD